MLPCPLPEDLPDPGIEPGSPALQADSLSIEHQGSPKQQANEQLLGQCRIKEEIHKYLISENENITQQNLWNAAKAILKGDFIAIQTHLEKQEKSQKT